MAKQAFGTLKGEHAELSERLASRDAELTSSRREAQLLRFVTG